MLGGYLAKIGLAVVGLVVGWFAFFRKKPTSQVTPDKAEEIKNKKMPEAAKHEGKAEGKEEEANKHLQNAEDKNKQADNLEGKIKENQGQIKNNEEKIEELKTPQPPTPNNGIADGFQNLGFDKPVEGEKK